MEHSHFYERVRYPFQTFVILTKNTASNLEKVALSDNVSAGIKSIRQGVIELSQDAGRTVLMVIVFVGLEQEYSGTMGDDGQAVEHSYSYEPVCYPFQTFIISTKNAVFHVSLCF